MCGFSLFSWGCIIENLRNSQGNQSQPLTLIFNNLSFEYHWFTLDFSGDNIILEFVINNQFRNEMTKPNHAI